MTTLSLLGLLFSFQSFANVTRADVEEIPLKRLIENGERQFAAFDETSLYAWWTKAEAVLSLARLHALGYAFKAEKFRAKEPLTEADKLFLATWSPGSELGEVSRQFPLKLPEAKDSAEQKAALKHLERSVFLYTQAAEHERTVNMGLLGLGWVLEQSNDKKGAIEAYRKLIKRSKVAAEKQPTIQGRITFPIGPKGLLISINATTKGGVQFSKPIADVVLRSYLDNNMSPLNFLLPDERKKFFYGKIDEISLAIRSKEPRSAIDKIKALGLEFESAYNQEAKRSISWVKDGFSKDRRSIDGLADLLDFQLSPQRSKLADLWAVKTISDCGKFPNYFLTKEGGFKRSDLCRLRLTANTGKLSSCFDESEFSGATPMVACIYLYVAKKKKKQACGDALVRLKKLKSRQGLENFNESICIAVAEGRTDVWRGYGKRPSLLDGFETMTEMDDEPISGVSVDVSVSEKQVQVSSASISGETYSEPEVYFYSSDESSSKKDRKKVQSFSVALTDLSGKVERETNASAPAFPSVKSVVDAAKDFKIENGIGKIMEAEAAEYLIRNLDPVKDKKEIQEIKDSVAALLHRFESRERWISPIAVSLSSSAERTELIDSTAKVPFDLAGTGIKQTWSWITPSAAWLIDLHGLKRGLPLSGRDLFGEFTYGSLWGNGFQALCALDDDGSLTVTGRELKDLALWRDSNSDGLVSSNEIISFDNFGVKGFSCDAEWNGHEFWNPKGLLLRNGSTRAIYDFMLSSQPIRY